MSIKLMSAVWPLKMNSTDKLVLIALADNASDEGVCWPSVATICKKSCLSRRGVQASVARLQKEGFLNRIFRNGHSNNYLIRIINGENAPAHVVRPPAHHTRTPCAPHAHPPAHVVHPEPSLEPSSEPSRNPFYQKKEKIYAKRKLTSDDVLERLKNKWTSETMAE